MFGFFTGKASVTIKGGAAGAAFIARVAEAEGAISEDQRRSIIDLETFTERLKEGYRRKVGEVYEDAQGERHTVEDAQGERHTVEDAQGERHTVESEDTKESGGETEEEKERVASVGPKEYYDIGVEEHSERSTQHYMEVMEEQTTKEEIFWSFIEGEDCIDLSTRPKKKWPNEVKSRIQQGSWKSFTRNFDPEAISRKDFGLEPGSLLTGVDYLGHRMVVITGNVADGKDVNMVFWKEGETFKAVIPEEVRDIFSEGAEEDMSLRDMISLSCVVEVLKAFRTKE